MPNTQLYGRYVAAVFAVLASFGSSAQFTGLTYEEVATSSVGTTYRVYANFADPTDIMQAVYGETPNGISVTSAAGFYQDPLGDFLPTGITPLLYPSFPNLAYDSWLTIGQEDNTVGDPIADVGGAGWTSAKLIFEGGGDFVVNDGVGGSVFALPSQVQAIPDANGQVLIAQLTTTGSWNMTCNIQWRDAQLNVFNELGLSIGYELVDYAGLSYELVGENTTGDGFDTYRVYANFIDDGAQVVAVYGLQDTALSVTTTSSFYQDPLGGFLATSINGLLFPSFPNLEYDSWMTIGADDVSGSVDQIGIDFLGFEAGGNLVVDDAVGGTWYILPDLEPSAFPDAEGRVLLAQLTTDGIVDLVFNLQYRSADGSNKQALQQALTFPVVTPGCIDPGACNYNPLADFDDGSCDFLSCAGREDRKQDAGHEDESSDGKGDINTLRNDACFSFVGHPELGDEPRQIGRHPGADADDEGLQHKSVTALLLRQLVRHQCPEGFHADVDAGIQDPEETGRHPKGGTVWHEEECQRTEYGPQQEIRTAAPPTRMPGSIAEVSNDRLNKQSRQGCRNPQQGNVVLGCAQRLEDAGHVAALKGETELDA